MDTTRQTLLRLVDLVMSRHPELAKPIRDLADRRLTEARVDDPPARELFSRIYREGLWGRSADPDRPFYSGSGSDDRTITSAYVDAVSAFVRSLPRPPSALDLGCGDFHVGRRIRPLCGTYVACDVVPELIEFNRHRYADLDVDFRVLDLSEDPLPPADLVFARQVLQHLSNARIRRFVRGLPGRFTYLVLTEHLPSSPSFPHNIDQPSSHLPRLRRNSGVVLTSPPFELQAIEARTLCEVREGPGIIRTTLYRLRR